MTDSRNLLENADYAEGESQSVTDFLEIDCNKCGNKIKFKLAIGDIKNVEEYIEQLEKTIQTQQEEIFKLQAKADRLKVARENWKKTYYQAEEEIEKKDNIVKSIISRLNNDIKNISETKTKKREHYLDDYTRCRLKAYKTKTREIKEYIKKEYFINKVEKEN